MSRPRVGQSVHPEPQGGDELVVRADQRAGPVKDDDPLSFQRAKGFVPDEAVHWLAQRYDTSPADVQGVISFYTMFHTRKPGKYVVDVCTNLSCSLWGAEKLLAHLEAKLGLVAGETSERFTLRETECLASCGTAPCLQINEEHHESLTRAKVDEIFARLP